MDETGLCSGDRTPRWIKGQSDRRVENRATQRSGDAGEPPAGKGATAHVRRAGRLLSPPHSVPHPRGQDPEAHSPDLGCEFSVHLDTLPEEHGQQPRPHLQHRGARGEGRRLRGDPQTPGYKALWHCGLRSAWAQEGHPYPSGAGPPRGPKPTRQTRASQARGPAPSVRSACLPIFSARLPSRLTCSVSPSPCPRKICHLIILH